MKSLKQLRPLQSSVFDAAKRDTVLNLAHACDGKIERTQSFDEPWGIARLNASPCITWLTTEVPEYVASGSHVLTLLECFATRRQDTLLNHGCRDAENAADLACSPRNRQGNAQ
jgi:hypothetical protein